MARPKLVCSMVVARAAPAALRRAATALPRAHMAPRLEPTTTFCGDSLALLQKHTPPHTL